MNNLSPLDLYNAAKAGYDEELTRLRNLPKNANIYVELKPQLDALATAHDWMERTRRQVFGEPPRHSKPKKE